MKSYTWFISKRISLSRFGKNNSPAIKVAITGVALSICIMLLSIAIVNGFKKEITDKVVGFNSEIILYPSYITDNIDDKAVEQINLLLEQDAFKNSKIRIMPDVHAGKGCVIGFTGDLGLKVIPNIVGVDIGCGMFCANLGKIDIDYKRLDDFINANIPSGMNVNEIRLVDFDLTRLRCFKSLKNLEWVENSLGSLGGGNHFIEIDESDDGEKYLVIHTGSRNLGVQVADFYQDLADQLVNHDLEGYYKKRDEILTTYKELGKEREIETALKELKKESEVSKEVIPYELAYLEGNNREDYLHDMKICQEFAVLNRLTIAKRIAEYMGWNIDNYFESVHNYISFDDNYALIVSSSLFNSCIFFIISSFLFSKYIFNSSIFLGSFSFIVPGRATIFLQVFPKKPALSNLSCSFAIASSDTYL